ncbi:TAP domain-containing protein [Alcanivorax sp. 521-1]|uniref:TAP domain-containing protein n=1 Tax=Alloalcanivorax profundimaris TaxID=2735259 RepID=A0ABS0AVJ9_9GAMM|nr:alpha/beta fold hydrolase [Alloalcanivorax profundimaris]MBF5058173.1 TAP domain-containing protein [Alloalcanivorax profundimaris]
MSVLYPARRLLVACLCILIVACGGDSNDSVAPADPLAGYRSQTVEWRQCDPAVLGEEREWAEILKGRVSCADIRVPMDYGAPGGDDLSVAMMRVSAEQPERKLGSLFFNPGGPGGDGLSMAAYFGELWGNADPDDTLGRHYKALSRRYDLIGFSPRGTGASSALICQSNELAPQPAFHGDRSPDNVDALLSYSELEARTCRKNPMAPYINTEQTVRDLDLMRHLVGEERLDYIGFSYGTWLGAWYAARFPDHVGRMLLDSNVNFTGDFSDASAGQIRALQRVLDGIVAPYAARHPDRYALGTSVDAIRDLFGRLPDPMKQLVSDSIPLNSRDAVEDALYMLKGASEVGDLVQANPDADEARIHELIDQDDYATDPEVNDTLTKAIHAVASEYFKEQAAQPEPIRIGRQDATYTAVVCNDVPVNPARDYWVQLGDDYAVEYPLNGGSITGQPCLFWGGANVEKPSIEAVVRAGTVLMVQSEYDALTITEGAMEMFDRLPTARLVFVDDEYSHGIFPYGTECVDSAVAEYFIEGAVPPRRTDCDGKPLPGDSSTHDARARSLTRGAEAARPSPYSDPERADAIRERIGDIIGNQGRRLGRYQR